MDDPLIRVLVVDDHPALQSGLQVVLDAQPGFAGLGVAADERELWPKLHATSPDVVLMDYHLPGTDGLELCRQLKTHIPAPKVVIYSAYADHRLAAPAMLAGADGVVNKATPAGELFAVVSRVAEGERVLPPLPPDDLERVLGEVDPADEPVIRALLAGATPAEAAETAGVEVASVPERVTRALHDLRVPVPAVPAP